MEAQGHLNHKEGHSLNPESWSCSLVGWIDNNALNFHSKNYSKLMNAICEIWYANRTKKLVLMFIKTGDKTKFL